MKRLGYSILFIFLTGCSTASVFDETELQSGCGDDDPRVGLSAELSEDHHDVSGTVHIVDNCTLEVRNFTYDGGGVHVRMTASADGDYDNGIHISENLKGTAFDNETLTLPLPAGVTLDDVEYLSVWCIPFDEDFGSAQFDY